MTPADLVTHGHCNVNYSIHVVNSGLHRVWSSFVLRPEATTLPFSSVRNLRSPTMWGRSGGC